MMKAFIYAFSLVYKFFSRTCMKGGKKEIDHKKHKRDRKKSVNE